jgi:lysophospholipase L1-like esterase
VSGEEEVGQEVIVQLDGLPRPATVVQRTPDQVLVRVRKGDGYDERWVPAAAVLDVEPTAKIPPLKLVGGAVVAVLGLALVFWPHGSNKPLLSDSPSPSPSASASVAPSPTGTAAASRSPSVLLFGDSFAAGRGNPAGTPTALELAAKDLGWRSAKLAVRGSGFTAEPTYATRLSAVTNPPDVMLLEGGASDTDASSAELTRAVTAVVTSLKRRFPQTDVVLMGPVAMEQPADAGLVRVNHVLADVAKATGVAYVDPLPWITSANTEQYISSTGFYPNAAGHRYLATRLSAALRALDL